MSKYPKLYHGTSFRALEMTAEERAQMRKDCNAMIESLCEYFMPIFSAGKITDMMVPLNYYKDQRIFHNLCNALKIISAEKNGNKQYDLGDFYVTTAEYKAVSYARSSFAFGETRILFLLASTLPSLPLITSMPVSSMKSVSLSASTKSDMSFLLFKNIAIEGNFLP